MKTVVYMNSMTINQPGVSIRYQATDVQQVRNILSQCTTESNIQSMLEQVNGSFRIVIETKAVVYLAVDRMAAMKLYYTIQDDILFIADKVEKLKNDNITFRLNQERVNLYKNTSFVSGSETLLENIYQVCAGEYVTIHMNEKKAERNLYFSYALTEGTEYKYDEFKKDVKAIAQRIGEKSKFQYYIPLSTGADSLLIACIFKLSGLNNITCFTYGKKNAREKNGSQKIANSLGFYWEFIEYTPKLWKTIEKSGLLRDYALFAGDYSESVHVQDFPAVQRIVANISPKDRQRICFVPGHTGVIGGGNVKNRIFKKDKYTYSDRVRLFGEKDYNIKSRNEKAVLHDMNLLSHLRSSDGTKEQEISFYQQWDMQQRQAKAILSSLRVYEFWGCTWELPLNDKILMKRLYSMPLLERMDKNIYKQYCYRLYRELSGIELPYISSVRQISNKFFRKIRNEQVRIFQLWNHDLRWFSLLPFRKKLRYVIDGWRTITAFTSEYYIQCIEQELKKEKQ